MKQFLFLFFIIITSSLSGGNIEQLNARFVDWYLEGNMVDWKKSVDSLRTAKLDKASELVLLYAEYGLIGNYLGTDKTELARIEIPFFELHIQDALKRFPNDANIYAFSTALVSYKIALQPWKAPFYCHMHSDNLQKAMECGPNTGLPLVEQANSLFFRPSLLGGDKPLSVKYYERAFDFYKKSGHNHWMYYNVGAWLGHVYASLGDKTKAEELFLQLLKEAPNFKWVKEGLLPSLKAGMNSNNYSPGNYLCLSRPKESMLYDFHFNHGGLY